MTKEENEYSCIVSPWERLVCRLRVSKAEFARALRIIDSLIKEIEKMGGKILEDVPYSRHYDGKIDAINFEGILFQFHLSELTTKILLPPSQRNKKWPYQSYIFTPTKKFSLTLKCTTSGIPDKAFKDGKTINLESRLRDVLISIKEIAQRKKYEEQQRHLKELRYQSRMRREKITEMVMSDN